MIRGENDCLQQGLWVFLMNKLKEVELLGFLLFNLVHLGYTGKKILIILEKGAKVSKVHHNNQDKSTTEEKCVFLFEGCQLESMYWAPLT